MLTLIYKVVVNLKSDLLHKFEIEKNGISRFQISFQISQIILQISNKFITFCSFCEELAKLLKSQIGLL